jgi:hypothetical protein
MLESMPLGWHCFPAGDANRIPWVNREIHNLFTRNKRRSAWVCRRAVSAQRVAPVISWERLSVLFSSGMSTLLAQVVGRRSRLPVLPPQPTKSGLSGAPLSPPVYSRFRVN